MTMVEEKAPTSTVPQKRGPDELDHLPTAPSPLNPNFTNSTKASPAIKEKIPMNRAPREKKESLKKRESKGGSLQSDARATPDKTVSNGSKKKLTGQEPKPSVIAPLRYKLPPPWPSDYEAPKGPVFVPHRVVESPDGRQIQFHETSEQ